MAADRGCRGAARRALRALLAAYRRALALAGRGLQLEGARQPQRQEPARASSPMLDALSANLLAEAAVVQAQAEASRETAGNAAEQDTAPRTAGAARAEATRLRPRARAREKAVGLGVWRTTRPSPKAS